jgi:hypothetical protein
MQNMVFKTFAWFSKHSNTTQNCVQTCFIAKPVLKGSQQQFKKNVFETLTGKNTSNQSGFQIIKRLKQFKPKWF